jgi:hypothetical protein
MEFAAGLWSAAACRGCELADLPCGATSLTPRFRCAVSKLVPQSGKSGSKLPHSRVALEDWFFRVTALLVSLDVDEND